MSQARAKQLPSEPRFMDEDQDMAHVLRPIIDDYDDDDNDDEDVGDDGDNAEVGRGAGLDRLANGHHASILPVHQVIVCEVMVFVVRYRY